MIEVIIVSGFLGAGKTTLIQRLLKNLEYEKIMLIENEFGEVNIDSSLFDSKLRITDINNGCICCSLDGKLDEALEDILKYDIDTLIVEPSGVAELSAIKDTFKDHPDFKLIAYTTVVDAKVMERYLRNFKEFYEDQIKSANTICLSHIEDLNEEQFKAVADRLKELNQEALIFSNTISDDLLLSTITSNTAVMEKDLAEIEHHHHHDEDEEEEHEHHHHDEDEDEHEHEHEHENEHEHGHHHHHHHHDHEAEDVFTNCGIQVQRAYSKEELQEILEGLSDNIVRAKGIVKSHDGTYLHFEHTISVNNIETYPDNHIGLISVIGVDIEEEEIREIFKVNA